MQDCIKLKHFEKEGIDRVQRKSIEWEKILGGIHQIGG